MTTPQIGPTASTADTSLATAKKSTGGALDKDAFLKLLVASMKYQDPSKPTDPAAYMAQLAQFAQVEKLDAISTGQADASRWAQTVAGQGMLGRTVIGKGSTGDLAGVVTAISMTAAGVPRLQLSTGGSLAVTDVTQVTPTPTTPTA